MLINNHIQHSDRAEALVAFAPKNVELILFDLDGTLVDSVGDLSWCGNEMLRRLDMPAHEPQAARNWVGNGIERFVKRVLTGDMEAEPEPALYERGKQIFSDLYPGPAKDNHPWHIPWQLNLKS